MPGERTQYWKKEKPPQLRGGAFKSLQKKSKSYAFRQEKGKKLTKKMGKKKNKKSENP